MAAKKTYEFGSFRLDPAERQLLCNDQPVALTPKAFDLLLVLVENSGHLLGKDELLKLIWPGQFVEESNLSFNISTLRKALGDGQNGQRYIETVPKKGFRFVAQVKVLDETARTSVEDQTLPGGSTIAAELKSKDAIATKDVQSQNWLARHLAVSVLAAAVLIVFVVGLIVFGLRRDRTMAAAYFQRTKIVKLTTDGNAVLAAISPDAKYVAYVLRGGANKQSLHLRQTSVANAVELIAPGEFTFQWLGFAPDGAQIHFNATRINPPAAGLFKVPTLGGAATLVKEGAVRFGSFSPDGKQMVYRSPNREARQEFLAIADAEMTTSRQLIARTKPEWLGGPGGGLEWSPGSASIATAATVMKGEEAEANILEVRVADGAAKPLLRDKWYSIGALGWLSDESGIVFVGQRQDEAFPQVWLLRSATGEARKITNDLSNYYGASLSADAANLVTMQTQTVSNIWAREATDQLAQITKGTGTYVSPTFAPDGKILYASDAQGSADIWEMNADGTHADQLTSNAKHNYSPVATLDNRYIVFESDRGGNRDIWRMNRDGSYAIQLTRGARESKHPVCSPDGRWVLYQGEGGPQKLERVWRVSIDGGERIEVADDISSRPTVSPDGKFIAYWKATLDDVNWRVEIVSFDGGTPIKTFDLPATAQRGAGLYNSFQFTPDGRSLAYIDTRGNVSNIWQLPLDGGAPRSLTDFHDGLIFSFAWSSDGKLVCARGNVITDAVLIKNAE